MIDQRSLRESICGPELLLGLHPDRSTGVVALRISLSGRSSSGELTSPEKARRALQNRALKNKRAHEKKTMTKMTWSKKLSSQMSQALQKKKMRMRIPRRLETARN